MGVQQHYGDSPVQHGPQARRRLGPDPHGAHVAHRPHAHSRTVQRYLLLDPLGWHHGRVWVLLERGFVPGGGVWSDLLRVPSILVLVHGGQPQPHPARAHHQGAGKRHRHLPRADHDLADHPPPRHVRVGYPGGDCLPQGPVRSCGAGVDGGLHAVLPRELLGGGGGHEHRHVRGVPRQHGQRAGRHRHRRLPLQRGLHRGRRLRLHCLHPRHIQGHKRVRHMQALRQGNVQHNNRRGAVGAVPVMPALHKLAGGQRRED
mmetsp:Transcript_31778/g.62045  ORF Transcript_31778/g.62045 Transcript_31778/m.62045 type:complete len:260 (+) Transcript_31778:74-853(+)